MDIHKATKVAAVFAAFCVRTFAEEGTVFIRQELPTVPSLIATKGTVGEQPCSFVIDTGAEITLFDQTLSSLLKSQIGAYPANDGSGRETSLPLYRAPALKFQRLLALNSTIALTNIRSISKYSDGVSSGVLGLSDITIGDLMIDNDRRLLEIHSSPCGLSKNFDSEIKLKENLAYPVFEAQISGSQGLFLIDTGYLGTILLESSLFSTLVNNGSIEVAESKAHTLGVSGSVVVRSGWFLKGDLMGKNLAGVAVHETSGPSSVGMQWLYGFNIEVDFLSRRFRYRQRTELQKPAATNLMLGAILTFQPTGAEIERLAPDPAGAAKLAGLEPGDIIESIESLSGEQMNYASVTELVTAKAGQAIKVHYLRKSDGAKAQTNLHLPLLISPWDFAGKTKPPSKSEE